MKNMLLKSVVIQVVFAVTAMCQSAESEIYTVYPSQKLTDTQSYVVTLQGGGDTTNLGDKV